MASERDQDAQETPSAALPALRELARLLARAAAREAFAEDQAAAGDDVEPEDEP